MVRLSLAPVLLILACGPSVPGGGHDAPGASDAAPDAGPVADAAPWPGRDGGGAVGVCERCRSYEDCGPGALCADTGAGPICLPLCAPGTNACPDGFTCGGVDRVFCAPVDNVCCLDEDGDSWGQGVGCFGPDCDDGDAARNPGAAERCDLLDNDCNPATPDGAAEPTTGETCDGDDGDLCAEGILGCEAGVMRCSDATGDRVELCNGLDDDCDPATADGSGDPDVGVECDGADADLCKEGTTACPGGVVLCDDATATAADLCNDVDDDCNPATADGADDPRVGVDCDGDDSDLCEEGATFCLGGEVLCGDTSGDDVELCNGLDDDCLAATADGSADPTVGVPCDGPDGDLCVEGASSCLGGAVHCSDTSTTNLDVCNELDDDCDPDSPDGSGDGRVGVPCDGPDLDACLEGTSTCSGGEVLCGDTSDSDRELCNGLDDDCIPGTPDGSGDPEVGVDCDGTADVDLCPEGKTYCAADGAIACSDPGDEDPELCNDRDDDCDPSTEDWADDPAVGQPCDGDDLDLCPEGVRSCGAGGVLVCDDVSASNVERCNGLDDDCIPATQDGSGDDRVNVECDGDDADACLEGRTYCDGLGEVGCGDPNDVDPERCNGIDDDCRDGLADDGDEDERVGLPCDGGDTDLCDEGTTYCAAGGVLRCDDASGNTPDLCDLNVDDDCNPTTPDGWGDPDVGRACDGDDLDQCTEGVFACPGGVLVCTDTSADTPEICNGVDDDCDTEIDEGFDKTRDPMNCGACGNVCAAATGTLCCASACTAASAGHCGACGVPCAPGLVVVNELLINPIGTGTDGTQEWFELYNPGPTALDLRGFTISDLDTDHHVISLNHDEPVLVPAGGYLVLGNSDNPDVNGDVPVAYQYGTFALGNTGGDEIIVEAFGTELDRVVWTSSTWDVDGSSNELGLDHRSHTANDDLANWCVASIEDVLPGGSHGTPGEENSCP